jgi:hypothetical protein
MTVKNFVDPFLSKTDVYFFFYFGGIVIMASKVRVLRAAYVCAVLEIGRYITVYHTGTSSCSRISYRHLSVY